MPDDYKKYEGSVSVNGDITPITRKSIPKINSTEWDNLSYESLFEQHTALETRLNIVRSMGRADLEKQIQHGLQALQLAMEKKKPDDEVTLL